MSFRFLPCRRKTGWLLRDWGCVVTSTTGAASLSKDTTERRILTRRRDHRHCWCCCWSAGEIDSQLPFLRSIGVGSDVGGDDDDDGGRGVIIASRQQRRR